MVMAYLIKTRNMSSDEAFAYVKKLKRNIMPNKGFA
jgi:predicted small secreted protein